MSQDNRARLKQLLESGEIRLQPLTFSQRELWEASPFPPSDVSNNICAFIEVRGLLTPAKSEAALQKVVDRQEVLRLSIVPGKNQPMQMIRKTAKPLLPFRELEPAENNPPGVEARADELFNKPFDFVQGPLYRAEVLKRAPDDHVIVFAIHHAIADGWTLGVFVQDLFTAYLQGVMNLPEPLPPVPLSYSDWGAADRAFWQPAELEKRAAFWKAHLAGTRRLWDTPTNSTLQRSVTQVSAAQGRAVRELARRNGATLFSTLLTAFQITLSKWTGSDDILVGTPVANRGKQAVRDTMGYCSGIVPIRGQIDPTSTFADSLRTVHESTIDCFENAMPFAELAKALGEPSAPGRNPIFEVRFALQNHPIPDVEMPTLSLKLRMRSTGTARFTLACEVNEEGDALEVAWLFPVGQFPSEDVQDLGRMYLAVLAGVCRSPEILTSALMTTLR